MNRNLIFVSLQTLVLIVGACDLFEGYEEGFLHEAGPILFLSDEDGTERQYQLFSTGPDGSAVRRLTKSRFIYGVGEAVWSPDGSTIALIQTGPRKDTLGIAGLSFVNRYGNRVSQCNINMDHWEIEDQGLVWSPDSQKIVYESKRDILSIIDINTCVSRIFKKPDTTYVHGYANIHRTRITDWPEVSNVLLGQTDYSISDPIGNERITTIKLTFWTPTGDLENVIGNEGERLTHPIMSPSGTQIVASKRIRNDWGKLLSVVRMSSTGGHATDLATSVNEATYPVAWSPDERKILAFREISGISQPFFIDVEPNTPDWISVFSQANVIPTSWRRN